jgi:hypothetical protein
MVMAAVLEPVPVSAETEYLTVPLPTPLALDVMLIHDGGFAAVQLQVPEVVTVTLPVPPAAVNDALPGEIT